MMNQMNQHTRALNHTRRDGFVLLAILVFILLLSMVTLSLLFRSQGEETAVNATAGSEQAWSAAMSGVEDAMRVAAAATPGSTDWQDDPVLFRQRLVYDDGADQWYFTVFSTAGSDSLVEFRYGLSDEASRLNLNHLGNADLTKIPQITAALADSIRQFIGAPPPTDQSTLAIIAPTPPQDSALATPASPDVTDLPDLPTNDPALATPHGSLATLDELLLAPGISWPLLHGQTASLVAVTQTNEDAVETSIPSDTSQTKRDHGLEQYFTVVSYDPNLNNAGTARANLNDPASSLPDVQLPAGFSNYVAALRSSNQQLAHPAEALEATTTFKNDKGVEVEVASGITKDELPLLLDYFTAEKAARHDGLVNINTASAAVLASLPGIDLALAETIVSTRTGLDPSRLTTIGWLYQERLVDAARFKLIAPALTARSFQFRFDVIGYGLPSGRYRVLEVIIDVAGGERHVTYLRDITRLGMPFNLKPDTNETITGESPVRRSRNAYFPKYRHG